MDSEPAVIETDPVTDLVLVVGPGKEHIPVESAILKAASPVFASMFSPPWLESQSKEITLPEDDPDAMRFITLTLSYHNEHELVTRPRTPQEILQIAIAVDKYNLYTALKFSLDYLLREASKRCTAENNEFMRDDMPGESLVYLCAAAYVLDLCEHFSKFALELICCHRSSFSELMDTELVDSIIPEKFFVLLAEKAGRFQLDVYWDILSCIDDRSSYRVCHCAWSASLCKRFRQFALDFGRPSEDGIGSALLSGIWDLRALLQEDFSWFKGECPQDGNPHMRIIRESLTFSHMVQRDLLNLQFCLSDLNSYTSCYADHATLPVAGPTN